MVTEYSVLARLKSLLLILKDRLKAGETGEVSGRLLDPGGNVICSLCLRQ